GHGLRLPGMPEDGVPERRRRTVVHEDRMCAHAPERRRADLEPRILGAVLDDAVPGADVVEQEVAERMILLPTAAGTTNEPPCITVPAGAVTIDWTWQTLQPIWLNSVAPACAAEVAASAVSRGGALVARMKRAKAKMSLLVSSGSATVSHWCVTSSGMS